MAKITIHDHANELRFEISGNLEGDCVPEIATQWKIAVGRAYHRKLTIDISGLSDYDLDGGQLLNDMYRHGMSFSGSTPQSLCILREISKPVSKAPESGIRNGIEIGKPAPNEPFQAQTWAAKARSAGS